MIGYIRIQGIKEKETTIIYTSYDNHLDYKLSLLPYTESLDIKTTSVHELIRDKTRVL